jgi:hypothetical protein
LKEWTTPDSRNTPSTTNLEGEEIVDAPGNVGNALMPEHVKRPNPWMMMMMMMMMGRRRRNLKEKLWYEVCEPVVTNWSELPAVS